MSRAADPPSGRRFRNLALLAFPMLVWVGLSTWWESKIRSSASIRYVEPALSLNWTARLIGETSIEQQQQEIETEADPPITSSPDRGTLRIDWSNLELKTDLAKEIYQHMHNCSLPRANYEWRIDKLRSGRNYGLGSELHTYGTIMVSALENGFRPMASKRWDWYNKQACDGSLSGLSCYFSDLEAVCPEEKIITRLMTSFGCLDRATKRYGRKPIEELQEARVAITELMFSSVSKLVVEEAQRQLNLVFPNGAVPKDLINVHVRWGDKTAEMKLIQVEDYVKAIQAMVEQHNLTSVSILLCTEDPAAVDAFKTQAPAEWKIYLDHFFVEYSPYRGNATYNVASDIAVSLEGKAGLWALASALVAAEANFHVLTIRSNWSRLINELRQIAEARTQVPTFVTNLGHVHEC